MERTITVRGIARRRLRAVHGPFAAIWVATAALFVVSPLIAGGSVGVSALKAILPFDGILAIAAVGQTLVPGTRRGSGRQSHRPDPQAFRSRPEPWWPS
jgi:hypothetical protein